MGRLWALYGAQFWRILANIWLYVPGYTSTGIGRFYGLILGDAVLLTRGGVGATAPTISPLYNHEPAARPNVFRKSPGQELTIPEKDRSGSETF